MRRQLNRGGDRPPNAALQRIAMVAMVVRRCTLDEVQDRLPRLSDDDYLKRVEELANVVCAEALQEGWLTYLPEDDDQTPLQRAINEMAQNLRHVHHQGDGCLDEDLNE